MRKLFTAILSGLFFTYATPAFADCSGFFLSSWIGYQLCFTSMTSCQGSGTAQNFTECSFYTRVPYPNFGSTFAQSRGHSQWCGMGGDLADSPTLVQVGLGSQISSAGVSTWNVWWADNTGSQNFFANTILGGDVMWFEVVCVTNCAVNQAGQQWKFTAIDLTQHWTATTTQNFVLSHPDSVEWNGEASLTLGGSTVDNFGLAPFTNLTVGVNGGTPTAANINQTSDTSYNFASNGDTFFPSGPNATNDGFNLAWGVNSTCQAVDPNATLSFAVGDPL